MTARALPPLLSRQDFESQAEYEQYLAIEQADYTDVPPASLDQKAYWKALADEHIGGERQKISLNIPKRNLSRIKAQALEQGLPYQTLINAVIQQWLQNGSGR